MHNQTRSQLPPPARYFPLAAGRYDVRPGLFRWGHDFGNGERDQQVFQFDNRRSDYLAEKQQARAEREGKYVTFGKPLPETLTAACAFIAKRLAAEHPGMFALTPSAAGVSTLTGQLSANRIPLGTDAVTGQACWTALGFEIQEDIALIEKSPDGVSRIAALHLCLPNYWGAEDKIGRTFTAIHKPVPGFETIAKSEIPLLDAIYQRGPFVRFAWGLSTDSRLNHHPEPPPGIPRAAWHGRRFESGEPSLYLRVERQTLWGLATQDVALFTIRTYLYDVANELADIERTSLAHAVDSMSPESAVYKGLQEDRAAITRWLRNMQSSR